MKPLYLRQCTICEKPMSKGYVFCNGEHYACTEKCKKSYYKNYWQDLKATQDEKEERADQLYLGWQVDENLGVFYGKNNLKVDEDELDFKKYGVIYANEVWDKTTQNTDWKEFVTYEF
jgi:hypothetical protein